MAKMYYSLEETIANLNCTEEQLKGLVRSGKLREFRDAGKLAYRVDEVSKLASETGDNVVVESEGDALELEDSGEIAMAPMEEESDSGITSALSGSGSAAGLSDLNLGGSDTGESLAELGESDAAGVLNLEDTGEADGELKLEDTGSDSSAGGEDDTAAVALEDSGADSGADEVGLEDSGSGTGADILSLDEVDKDVVEGMKKDDTVITNIGISVFDDEDLEITADPMAKTLLTGADEHLGLDGSGAGSGLLDLTRESDDTSLGAELLEGIDMGGEASEAVPAAPAVAEGDTDTAEPVAEEEAILPEAQAEPAVAAASVAQVQVVGALPPVSPAFTGLLIAAAVALVLAGALSIATAMQVWPTYLAFLADYFGFFMGGTVLVGGLFALIGWLVGRSPSGPRAKPAKKKPAKKSKATKAKKGKKESSG